MENRQREGWGLKQGHEFVCNSRTSELIELVDSFAGEPTDADIERIALEFGDTSVWVRHCFEAREERAKARKRSKPTPRR